MGHLSISERLHEELSRLIAATEPGERLLSEPQLARQLGVSRATLREAMRTFETQGLIRRRQGSGTFVAQPPQVIDSGLEVLESIETLADRIGLPVSMGEFHLEHRAPSPEEQRALNLIASQPVVALARVILAEGRPAAYLVDVVPEDVIEPDDFPADFTGSVLDLLLAKGRPQLTTSRCEINADIASHEIARKMGIQRGDVLLRFRSYLYNDDGQVIDYSLSYFLPGYFRFHVVRRVG